MTPSDQQRPGLLLLGMARSGTTFLGELFRQNPSLSYLFEPFAKTPVAAQEFCWITEQSNQDANAALLSDVFFGRFDSLFEIAPQNREWLANHGWNGRSSPPSHLVIKEIKLNMHLRWVSQVLGPSLKVIHLVRDPRGIVDSFLYKKEPTPKRAGLFASVAGGSPDSQELFKHWGWNQTGHDLRLSPQFEDYAAAITSGMPLENVAARWAVLVGQAVHDASFLMPEQYLRVRYEDLCKEPQSTAESLYAFAGMSLPSEVTDWISENTGSGSRDNRYGTSRNSREMADIWRTRMEAQQVAEVNRICRSVMQQIGYC